MNTGAILSSLNEGEYAKALKIAQGSTSRTSIYFQIHIYYYFEQFEKARAILSERNQLRPVTEEEKLAYHAVIAESQFRSQDFDLLQQTFSEADDYLSHLGSFSSENSFWKGVYLSIKGMFSQETNNLTEALAYFDTSLEAFKHANISNFEHKIQNLKGDVYYDMGYYEDALQTYYAVYSQLKERKASPEKGYSLYNMGRIHEVRGDLNHAKKYYTMSTETFSSTELWIKSYKPKIRLGSILLKQGEIEFAESIFAELKNEVLKTEHKQHLTSIFFYEGLINQRNCNYSKSLDLFVTVFGLQENHVSDIELTSTLLQVGKTLSYMQANENPLKFDYMQKFDKIASQNTNPLIQARYKLARALDLKSRSRLKHHIEAQGIFEKLAFDSEIEDFEIKTVSIINLLEILIIQHNVFHSESGLDFKKAYQYLDDIIHTANQQKNLLVQIEAQFVKSKLYFAENRLSEALELLLEIHQNSIDFNLENTRNKIARQITQINYINDATKTMSSDISPSVEGITDYLNELSKIL